MTSICRLCLLAGPDLAPMLELTVETRSSVKPESSDLSELVARYLSIDPLIHSPIATYICTECRNTIAKWHWFREACLQNDAMYQKMTQDPDEDNPVEEALFTVEIKEEPSVEFSEIMFPNLVEATLEQEYLPKKMFKKKKSKPQQVEGGEPVAKKRGRPQLPKKEKQPKKRGRPKLPEHERTPKYPTQMCTLCGKLVKNMGCHLRMHNQDRRYECPHCPKKFIGQSTWKNHVNVHTKELKFSCSVCDAFFWRLRTLQTHMLKHSDEATFKCKMCPKAFRSRSAFVGHRKTHTQPPDVECPGCDKMFYKKEAMQRHYVKHMAEKPYICKICGRGYTRKPYLRVHMERDHPEAKTDKPTDIKNDSEEIPTV